MNKNVFRKVTIDRLSSPEQLDSLVRVTSPRGWIALCGIGLLIAAVLYWGFFGTLSTTVSGQGVLIHSGGQKTIYTSVPGIISDISVVEQDRVNKGEVIAWLEQPDLLEKISQTKQAIASLRQNGEEDQGELRILERKLEQLLVQYEQVSKVTSAYAGSVVEVQAAVGQNVESGAPIIRLETFEEENDDLIAVMYVPVQQGKRLLPGMDVRLSPTSVNREEYGSLVGRIISVSDFPVTTQGMMAVLGNEGLVAQMAQYSVALEVRVSLIPDENTYSGYFWTTKEGPPIRLSSGTLVDATITVESHRPIGMVIDQLK